MQLSYTIASFCYWLQHPIFLQGFAKWLSWTSFDTRLTIELWSHFGCDKEWLSSLCRRRKCHRNTLDNSNVGLHGVASTETCLQAWEFTNCTSANCQSGFKVQRWVTRVKWCLRQPCETNRNRVNEDQRSKVMYSTMSDFKWLCPALTKECSSSLKLRDLISSSTSLPQSCRNCLCLASNLLQHKQKIN